MKTIEEFDRYMIDKDGQVYSCLKGRGVKTVNSYEPQRKIKAVLDTTGYLVVNLTDGTRKVNRSIHRLLALAYIPNPNNLPQVNHIDGNKTNNSLDNLEWVSAKTNTQHAIDIGLTCPSKRHPSNAPVIQYDLLGGYLQEHRSLHDAERATGVAWQNISKVCRSIRKTAGGFKWAYK